MSHIKKSTVRPLRRDNRHFQSENSSQSGYFQFSCSVCGERFSSLSNNFAYCPNCDSILTSSYHTGTPNNNSNTSIDNYARPRQLEAQASVRGHARSSTLHNVNTAVHQRIATERFERQLPSIREVPVLRRALEEVIPPPRDPGGQQANSLSLRNGQDEQLDLPPLRTRQAAQHNRGAERQQQGRQVLPDPRNLPPHSSASQRSSPSSNRLHSYDNYYG